MQEIPRITSNYRVCLWSYPEAYLIRTTQKNHVPSSDMSAHHPVPQTQFILKIDASQAVKIHGYICLTAENYEAPLGREVGQVLTLPKLQQLHLHPQFLPCQWHTFTILPLNLRDI